MTTDGQQQTAAARPAVPLYKALARTLQAYQTCLERGNDWHRQHAERLRALVKEHMPSGAGWDCGTTFDLEDSAPERLRFSGAWHHMNDTGMYDGWTEHTITVRPSLAFDFDLRITGRDRNGVKDVLHEWFAEALRQPVSD